MRTLILLCVTALAFRFVSPCQAQLSDVLNKASEVAKKGKKVKDIYTPWSAEQEQEARRAIAIRRCFKCISIQTGRD